jgi:hypothetical protein
MNKRGRRRLAGVAGALMWSALSIEAWTVSYGFYEDHYKFPLEKYGVLSPLRWQDITFLAGFWIVIVALFWVSYRLVRYALSDAVIRGSSANLSFGTSR